MAWLTVFLGVDENLLERSWAYSKLDRAEFDPFDPVDEQVDLEFDKGSHFEFDSVGATADGPDSDILDGPDSELIVFVWLATEWAVVTAAE